MNRLLKGEGTPARFPPPCTPVNLPDTDTPIGGDEIHVWTADLDSSAGSPDRLWVLLSPEERLRAERFHFEHHQRRFVTGRGILRRLLGRYLSLPPEQLEFCYGPHGKPALADHQASDLRFNLSHAEGLAIYAFVRRQEIGVDVERIRPLDAETLARRFFARGEYEALRTLPEDQRLAAFFACWTRKEAFLKARGDGLALPLERFEVSVAPAERARLLSLDGSPAEASQGFLHGFTPAPRYVAALAIEGGADWRLVRAEWSS